MGVCPLFVFGGTTGRGLLTVSHDEALLREVGSIAGRVARSYGLEIFDVQLRRESIGWVLRVILDRRPNADALNGDPNRVTVSIGDCKQVSQDLSVVLDAEVTFEHAYTLEVSSPGLDRPLRHLSDCRRFVGCLATIVTTKPVDGQHHLAGRITGVENEQVVLAAGRRAHRVPWSVISRARLDVEF